MIPAQAHAGWVTGVQTHIRVNSEESPQNLLIERMLKESSTASGLLLNDSASFALLQSATPSGHGGRLSLGAAASGLATVIVPPSGQDIAAKHLAVSAATWHDPLESLGGPVDSGFMSGTLGGNRLPPSLSGTPGGAARLGGGYSPSVTTPGKLTFEVPLSDNRGDLALTPTSASGGMDIFGATNGGPLFTSFASDLSQSPALVHDADGGFATPGPLGFTPPVDSAIVSPYGLDPVPTPEPASLTAAGIGIASVLGYGWTRRRKLATTA